MEIEIYMCASRSSSWDWFQLTQHQESEGLLEVVVVDDCRVLWNGAVGFVQELIHIHVWIEVNERAFRG